MQVIDPVLFVIAIAGRIGIRQSRARAGRRILCPTNRSVSGGDEVTSVENKIGRVALEVAAIAVCVSGWCACRHTMNLTLSGCAPNVLKFPGGVGTPSVSAE